MHTVYGGREQARRFTCGIETINEILRQYVIERRLSTNGALAALGSGSCRFQICAKSVGACLCVEVQEKMQMGLPVPVPKKWSSIELPPGIKLLRTKQKEVMGAPPVTPSEHDVYATSAEN